MCLPCEKMLLFLSVRRYTLQICLAGCMINYQHNGPVVTMSQHFIKQQLPLFQISFTCNKTFTMPQICCFINPDRQKYQSFIYVFQHKEITKQKHNYMKFFYSGYSLRFSAEGGGGNQPYGGQGLRIFGILGQVLMVVESCQNMKYENECEKEPKRQDFGLQCQTSLMSYPLLFDP